MNLNEECLLEYLKEPPSPYGTGAKSSQPYDLEALKPVYRRSRYVSFPVSIILQKVQGLLS